MAKPTQMTNFPPFDPKILTLESLEKAARRYSIARDTSREAVIMAFLRQIYDEHDIARAKYMTLPEVQLVLTSLKEDDWRIVACGKAWNYVKMAVANVRLRSGPEDEEMTKMMRTLDIAG